MFSRALYYPQIRIPDNAWLRRAILYWDEVNPIVPWQLVQSIPADHVYHRLHAEGLSTAIDPEHIVHSIGFDQFETEFLGRVSDPAYLARVRPGTYGMRIHGGKLSDEVLSRLPDLRLAQPDGEWWQFEPATGSLYMSYLAAAVARSEGLEPLTDRGESNASLLSSQLEPVPVQQTFAQFVLENLIPAPRAEVPVDEIIGFRTRHEEELLRFRRAVRGIFESLGEAGDEEEVRRKLDAVKDEVREQSLALARQLQETRIETVFNVLEVSFPTSIEGLAAAVAHPIGAVLGGARAVLRIGRQVLDGRIRRNSLLADSPYTYVYRVEQGLAD